MRKTIALTSFLFCIALVAHAQQPSWRTALGKFELVAGPSFSQNTGYLGNDNYQSLNGGAIGLGYYIPVGKSFSINLRGLYERKGSVAIMRYGLGDQNGITTNINAEVTSRFTYLTGYVIPTFHFGQKKNIHIGAGGYYSYLYSLHVNFYNTRMDNGEFISESNYDQKSYYQPDYDAGVTFQLGYSFTLFDQVKLTTQAFSNRGLKDLYNGSIGSQRNNTFGLLVSLRLL
jgi:hypothetical protein